MHSSILSIISIMLQSWSLYNYLISFLILIILFLLFMLHLVKSKTNKLHEYYKALFEILDNLPFPIMVKDIQDNFRYSYWNKEAEIRSGIKREKAIKYTDYEIFGEEKGKKFRNIDKSIVETGDMYRGEEDYVTKDGTVLDTISVKAIIKWKNNKKWLLSTRWDITKLKTYERELVAAKEQLEQAINKQKLALKSINFGLIYIDKNYKVQWQETTQIINLVKNRCYCEGQVCYKTSALRDYPCEKCAFREAIEQKKIVRHTIKVDQVDFEITATPVFNDDGNEILGALLRFEDITEKLKMDRLLQEAKDKAEESNRLKSAFLANMSHEIRTPLNAIIGFSEIITQVEAKEEKEEYMKIIATNNELLLHLIDDVLDLSKIESGAMNFNFTLININELMESICKQMQEKNRSSDLIITFSEKAETCILNTDRIRLSQVIINLTNNAMKFTPKGSIKLGYTVDEEKDEIFCYVKDTGIGIPADKIDQIFERFVKLNTFVNGTGLGLSICQVIIERLGGTIGVESKEGEGSCFWFNLPMNNRSLALN